MRLPELLNELKRRRVYRVSVAFVVAVFAALEAADLILPALLAPPWVYRALVIVGLIGVGAWFAGRWSALAPSIDPSATLVILPFAPATEDPELLRIGRELVVTLSHSLAATAELDVAEPLAVLATIDPDDDKLSPDRTREVAT